MGYTFLLETPPTPIHRRIAAGLTQALLCQGQRVLQFSAAQVPSGAALLPQIARAGVDWVLVTTQGDLFCDPLPDQDSFVFAQSPVPVVFLHHETLLSHCLDRPAIAQGWRAFQEAAAQTRHFCLERHNVTALQNLGVHQAWQTDHASEFTYFDPQGEYWYDVSFVGHVLPGLGEKLAQLPPPLAHLRQAIEARLQDLTTPLGPAGRALSPDPAGLLEDLTEATLHLALAHRISQQFRGALLNRLEGVTVDIIGGDPAYLRQSGEPLRYLDSPHIRTHPPTANEQATAEVYARSRINLNITSLQFDAAVINRVIDVGAVGGFILTDWREDLARITSVHEEIAYRTPEELNAKIHYYLSHEAERLAVAKQLHRDVREGYTYGHKAQNMLRYL
ncbi:MAG: glycosyltransferase family 1 protein [Gloeomargaritaceae cyanobacterium C42_A2020_066]|nr:glycosyltransferase family 1 protein [Gloeomargaritaceae cyanobacterium C42_A2020_066]